LLRVAETAWTDGAAVDPALALPLYVRDKIAETEAERAARSARHSR
jgi:tRNA threonylcarbamoyladenosine biosynthesis protein TsaB